ncbi:MAG: hypothetical protein IT204_17915 [Fimbriimonadaceae bacterium]|nr:hypothetical protein [Fimbriimonadaceae bacterium]
MSSTPSPATRLRQAVLGGLLLLLLWAGLWVAASRLQRPVAKLVSPPAAIASGPTDGGFDETSPQPDRDPFLPPGGATPEAAGDEPPASSDGAAPGPIIPAPVAPGGEAPGPPAPDEPAPPAPDEPAPPAPSTTDRPRPRRRGGEGSRPAAEPARRPAGPSVAELRAFDPADPPAFGDPPALDEAALQPVGVIRNQDPARSAALFRTREGDRTVRVGQLIGDYRLEAVLDEAVLLLRDGHRWRVPLRRSTAPAAGTNQPPAADSENDGPAATAPRPNRPPGRRAGPTRPAAPGALPFDPPPGLDTAP